MPETGELINNRSFSLSVLVAGNLRSGAQRGEGPLPDHKLLVVSHAAEEGRGALYKGPIVHYLPL